MKQLLFIATISLLCLNTNAQVKSTNNSATIKGNLENWKPGDTVSIFLWTEYLTYLESSYFPPTQLKVAVKKGEFSIDISPVKKTMYFSLEKNAKDYYGVKPIEHYIIEAGDEILITEKQNTFSFMGTGYQKYECRQKLDSSLSEEKKQFSSETKVITNADKDELILDIVSKCQNTRSILDKQMNIIQQYQTVLSKEAYQLLTIDQIARVQLPVVNSIGFSLFMNSIETADDRNLLKQNIAKCLLDVQASVPEELLAESTQFPAYYFKLLQAEYALNGRTKSYWTTIKEKYKGALRDELLSIIFFEGYKYLNNQDSLANDALSVIETPFLANFISEIHSPRKTGVLMKNFSLPDIKDSLVTLSDYKGKVVFLDFWFTGCAPCAIYYRGAVSKAKEYFQNNPDVVFIAISGDSDKEKWVNGIKSGKYTSLGAVNLYLEGLGFDEHPLTKYYKIAGAPTPILIDREGKIFNSNAFALGSGKNPDPQKLISKIEEALR